MGLAASIYNKQEAIERLEGDEDLFADMAGMFVTDAESYCVALAEALKSGDAKALRREAHTVKSLFATFSCEGGRELAERLEHLAAEGRLDGASALTFELIAVARRLREALANDLA